MMMKKWISIFLVLIMLCGLFCGCESGLEPDDGGDKPDKPSVETTAPQETTEPEDLIPAQRQLYYDFLKNVHIPEVGLAELSEISWIHSNMRGGVESNPQHLLDNGYGGLLSAVVRDFDLDGDQDMVTFYMTALPHNETWPAIYGGKFNFPDHVVSMSFFTLENGEVAYRDTYPCAILLDGSSWGYISIRMEQLEDGIYIRCGSNATDYNTYGASPSTIFHIADDKFVFDYISGIHYGQSSLDENPNLLMGTTNINPADYTFDSITKSAADTDPAGDEENRWIYWGAFKEPDNSNTMSYVGTDYTGLRIILEQGIDAFPHEPLPQGGKKPPNPVVEAGKLEAQKLADHVAAQCGLNFINITTYYSSYDNTASIRFETEEYTFLTVVFNGDSNTVTRVGVSTNDYPVPQEWFDMKDALLQYSEFGLISSELSPFLGKKISYNNHMNGTEITGATITIMQITDTLFSISFPE